MKVLIDKKAKKFINSKGFNELEIWMEGCSSWGVGEPQPSVKMGKPEDLDLFDKYEYFTFGEIEHLLKRYVSFYNNERLHGLLGKITPMEKWNKDKHLIMRDKEIA